jgi:hypothetical protein
MTGFGSSDCEILRLESEKSIHMRIDRLEKTALGLIS